LFNLGTFVLQLTDSGGSSKAEFSGSRCNVFRCEVPLRGTAQPSECQSPDRVCPAYGREVV